jgi:hypothetical protein
MNAKLGLRLRICVGRNTQLGANVRKQPRVGMPEAGVPPRTSDCWEISESERLGSQPVSTVDHTALCISQPRSKCANANCVYVGVMLLCLHNSYRVATNLHSFTHSTAQLWATMPDWTANWCQ